VKDRKGINGKVGTKAKSERRYPRFFKVLGQKTPAPELPEEIVEKTREKYHQVYHKLVKS